MTKVLIVCALFKEAEALINHLNAKPITGFTQELWNEGTLPSYYHFPEGALVLSGMGVHAAQLAVTQHASRFDEIWNIGLAGSLNSSPSIGTILPVKSVGKYVSLSKEETDPITYSCMERHLPHMLLGDQGERLISSDFPIHNQEHRSVLSSNWDLVDMEGYGIAYAAKHLKKTCRMWKIISDFSAPGGRALIEKHIAELSEKLALHVKEELIKKSHTKAN